MRTVTNIRSSFPQLLKEIEKHYSVVFKDRWESNRCGFSYLWVKVWDIYEVKRYLLWNSKWLIGSLQFVTNGDLHVFSHFAAHNNFIEGICAALEDGGSPPVTFSRIEEKPVSEPYWRCR